MTKLTKRVSKFSPKKNLQDWPLIKHFGINLITICKLDPFRAVREKNPQ